MGSKKTFDKSAQADIEKEQVIRELTQTLQKGLDKQDERFKDIPTPVDFAKLETDVKHHGYLIYALIPILIGGLIGGYSHFDNKITNINEGINLEIKDLRKTHTSLNDKINSVDKDVSKRIDSIIIQGKRPLDNIDIPEQGEIDTITQ